MEEKIQQTPLIYPLMKDESASYKLVVSTELEKKIRYLCNKSPNNEWSGVLFYKYDGSFTKGDLVITALDLCLMGLGNSTYTEFYENPDIISYAVDHDLIGMQIGLIHSHQAFSTFFSGTDIQTLREEGSCRNNFVSLIVNNEGTYTAAITSKIYRTSKYKDTICFFDEPTISNDYSPKEEVIVVYNMLSVDIESSINEFTELDARFKELEVTSIKDIAGMQTTIPFQDMEENITVHGSLPGVTDFINQITVLDKEEDYENYISNIEFNINPKILNSLLRQIMLGGVFGGDNSIDLDLLKQNVAKKYQQRFSNIDTMHIWINSILCILLDYDCIDIDLANKGYCRDEIVSLYAEAMKEFFEKIPNSNFKDIILSELDLYQI